VAVFGVCRPAPGGHQVELAQADQLLGSEAVSVQQLPSSSQVTFGREGPQLSREGVSMRRSALVVMEETLGRIDVLINIC
jgi:hypothetical protein